MTQTSYVMASAMANAEISEGMAPTLTAHAKKQAPILVSSHHEPICAVDGNANSAIDVNLSGTLKVGGEPSYVASPVELALEEAVTISDGTSWVVRRLTPTECERLMGFPDGWTDIGDWVDSKGKRRKTADGNRYKALGNSFVVPTVRWIAERIEEVDLWL